MGIGLHQVVVLPFVSGGGIKNKVLEAASLGKAVVCTPRACNGLRAGTPLPFAIASRPGQWVREIVSLWRDAARRNHLGTEARRWVLEHHNWAVTASDAVAGIRSSLQGTSN
jgi:polysaccharide biosynthesis protein PslH